MTGSEEIKTFKQARQRLEAMAAGQYCEVQVKWCGGESAGGHVQPYLRCELYIEGVGTTSAKNYPEAFAAMEARIKALDSDSDPEALAAGVDEAVAEVPA